MDRLGYGRLTRLKSGKRRNLLAHRYVYAVAAGVRIEDLDGQVVRHKCDNRRCVNPDHLQLGTQADNVLDMDKRGRSNRAGGEKHGMAKLTAAQVLEIRAAAATQKELAKRYGVCQDTICSIINRYTWRNL